MSSNSLAPARARPVFSGPWLIVGAAALSAFLVGALLTIELQLGIALFIGALYLPVALLNLPLAIALWIPLVYIQAWEGARFIPAAVALLLAVAWLGSLGARTSVATRVLWRHRGVFALAGAFLAWMTLSTAWAVDPAASVGHVWLFYVAITIVVVLATTLCTRRHLVFVCVGFVAGAFLSAAIAFPQLSLDATAEDTARLGGSVQDPNYLAASLLAAGVVATGLLAVVRAGAAKMFVVVVIGLLAIAFVATGSRGGLIAAAVATVAALVLVRRGRLKLGALITVAVAIAALWAVSASPATLERATTFDSGGTGRVDLWSVAWRIAEDNPVLGVGLNNYRAEAPRYVLHPGQLEQVQLIVETPKVAHNAYLEFLAETGVIGASLFVLLAGALLRTSWRGIRSLEEAGDHAVAGLGYGVLIAQVAALGALLFLSNPFNPPLWILLSLGPVLATIAGRAVENPARS